MWLTLACSTPQSVPLPSPVDISLVTVESTALHRVLVFRTCGDQGCSSDTYLQWLEGTPPQVIHTAPVPELGSGTVVRSLRWVRNRSRISLVAILDLRRPDAEPLTVYLLPHGPGRYEVER